MPGANHALSGCIFYNHGVFIPRPWPNWYISYQGKWQVELNFETQQKKISTKKPGLNMSPFLKIFKKITIIVVLVA